MSHVRTSTHRSLLSAIWVLVDQWLKGLTGHQKVACSIPVWGSETYFWVCDKAWVANNYIIYNVYNVIVLLYYLLSSIMALFRRANRYSDVLAMVPTWLIKDWKTIVNTFKDVILRDWIYILKPFSLIWNFHELLLNSLMIHEVTAVFI